MVVFVENDMTICCMMLMQIHREDKKERINQPEQGYNIEKIITFQQVVLVFVGDIRLK